MGQIEEFKRKLIDTGLFQKVSGDGQYVCKTCPFCGDTKKHMYVLIKLGDDSPVLYNCFKCNARGVMNQSFISYFGIDDMVIPKTRGRRKVHMESDHVGPMELIQFDRDIDMVLNAKKYIESRVHVFPSDEDCKSFQLIGNPFEYVDGYLGGDHRGLSNRIWFRLSNGNMIGREIVSSNQDRWKKRNYVGKIAETHAGIYIIKKPVHVDQTINVCICEGVFDAIGLYYHGSISNPVFIACMGRDYVNGIKYVLNSGIFGDSVCIRIYKDADVNHVKIPKEYTRYFKSIQVYRNTLEKDYGFPSDCIELELCDRIV